LRSLGKKKKTHPYDGEVRGNLTVVSKKKHRAASLTSGEGEAQGLSGSCRQGRRPHQCSTQSKQNKPNAGGSQLNKKKTIHSS